MSSLPIANLLNQKIYVQKCIGKSNDMGDVRYSNPELHRCRIDFKSGISYGLNGVSVPSVASVYLDYQIGINDRFVIPPLTTPQPAGTVMYDTEMGVGWMTYDTNVGNTSSETINGILSRSSLKVDVPNRYDFSRLDFESVLQSGWVFDGDNLVRCPISVSTLFDGRGKFSHCEVAV